MLLLQQWESEEQEGKLYPAQVRSLTKFSHVVNTLARAGVKKLRIIDFDLVSVSSLNRHAFTYRDDVGASKVGSTQKYLERIYPDIDCEIVAEFLNIENCEKLLGGDVDFVADCIDDLDTKTELLIHCVKNNIPIISSGGAGMKIDPSQIQIRDIVDCSYDKMTKRLKDNVKKYIKAHPEEFDKDSCFQLREVAGDLKLKIPMVISAEKVSKKLMPLQSFQKEDPDNFRAIPGLRLRTVPVVGTQPALFGIRIASYILNQLLKIDTEGFSQREDATHLNYVKLEDKISSVVAKHKLQNLVDYNITDIYYAAREMWQFKCVKTGLFKPRQILVIWDKTKLINKFNLLLVNTTFAKKINSCKPGEDQEVKLQHFTQEQIDEIERKFEEFRTQFAEEEELYTCHM